MKRHARKHENTHTNYTIKQVHFYSGILGDSSPEEVGPSGRFAIEVALLVFFPSEAAVSVWYGLDSFVSCCASVDPSVHECRDNNEKSDILHSATDAPALVRGDYYHAFAGSYRFDSGESSRTRLVFLLRRSTVFYQLVNLKAVSLYRR